MAMKLEHVSYTYMPGTPYEKEALKDVSLEIKKGEFVAVIGHTGSGKSTLVQNLNGLLRPTKGTASLDGVDLSGKTKEARAARGRIGMVFQYPEHQLFAESVYEDIAFGPQNLGLNHDETDARVHEAMKFVGLDFETYAGRSPFSLSGGQMRRVAIAGVVAMNPDYLILDEPSAGLDPGSRNAVFAEVMELYNKRNIGIIGKISGMEPVLTSERIPLLDKIGNTNQQFFRIERLNQISICTSLQSANLIFFTCLCRDNNNRDMVGVDICANSFT